MITDRTLLRLGGAAALSVVVAFIFGRAPDAAGTAASDLAAPSLIAVNHAAGTLSQLAITGPDGSYLLARTTPTPVDLDQAAEGWAIASKGNFPVLPGAIRPVLAALRDLRVTAPRTAQPALLGRLALDGPGPGAGGHLLELEGTGTKAEIIAGRRRTDALGGAGGGSYLRLPGSDQAWLVQPTLPVPERVADWVDRRILDIDPARITQIRSQIAGSDEILLDRSGPEQKLRPDPVPAGVTLRPGDPGAEIAKAFQLLEFVDVAPAGTVAADPVVGATRVATSDGMAVSFTLYRHDNQPWFTVSAAGPGSAGITARTTAWAYRADYRRSTHLGISLRDFLPAPTPTH